MAQSAIDIFNRASQLQATGNFGEALRILQIAADNGYAPALQRLGDTFSYAIGVEQNFTKAFEFYYRAACTGLAISQYKVGWSFQFGVGVPRDYNKAIEFYFLAADQEYPLAQFCLAWCYEHGVGVEKNPQKAKEYFEKSAQGGMDEALYRVGENCEIDEYSAQTGPYNVIQPLEIE
ncbi:1929_t:CDS:2 [Paraglomus occultum]|uniref:1929_t:CDS:1 n=1 Tax=Paraglomus occultum TaxID=144539 RepID=A0A9N9AQX1_9GLOM|nr:1929_t:CDS:2 [Paraglomus occultum]